MHSIVIDAVFLLPGFKVEIVLYIQGNLFLKTKSKKSSIASRISVQKPHLFITRTARRIQEVECKNKSNFK